MLQSSGTIIYSFILILIATTYAVLSTFKTVERLRDKEQWYKWGIAAGIGWSFAVYFFLFLLKA